MAETAPPESKACGFVLTRRRAERVEYLLLVNRRRGEAGLPKGHREGEESEVETALRETAEETGLTDVRVDPWFRRTLRYPALRRGVVHDKTVVYLLGEARAGVVRLSEEHSAARWVGLGDALREIPFEGLRGVVRDAALFLKDPALFLLEPRSESDAFAHLSFLPEADDRLLAHLRGGADLARTFAKALRGAGAAVHVEAAAAGTLLHDVGRALGLHEDHQRQGLLHLRGTPLAAYGFACVSHFTKGADDESLVAAGLAKDLVADFRRLIDGSSLTWEERCAALADACMKGPTPVPPPERFRDLRRRYDAKALIDLQERRTEAIRAEIEGAIGKDPLGLVGLAPGS
jgi:8-oxo-dGTP pyrophosphatase MutT (NUDIX family)